MTRATLTTTTPARTIQDHINDYWDYRAEDYDTAQQRPERRAADREVWSGVFRGVLPGHPIRILDVGTGSGFLAFVLAELGHDVTAIDLSASMLERGERRARTEKARPLFQLGDAVDPPFPPSTFDAITSRYVMWTLREPVTAALNWFSLLRPGGTLAMVDALWFPEGIDDNPTEGFREHYSPRVRSELPLAETSTIQESAAVLSSAGFTRVEVTPLRSVYELDTAFGTVPGHEVTLQYLITARRPLRSSRPQPDVPSIQGVTRTT